MIQVFPAGPSPKVPTSSCSSAVPVHIHTCELSPLHSPFPKPSREQVTQLGVQMSPTSTTPHPAPHPFCAKWKESPSRCLARHIQQQRWAQQLQQNKAAWTKGRRCRRCSLPLWREIPTSWGIWSQLLCWPAAPTSFWTTRCCRVPKQQKNTHIHLCLSSRFLLWQSIFSLEKGVGKGGLGNTTTAPRMGAGVPHWLSGCDKSLPPRLVVLTQEWSIGPYATNSLHFPSAHRMGLSASCVMLSLLQSGTIAPACVS